MRYMICLSVGVVLFWLMQPPQLVQSADRPAGYPDKFGHHWLSSHPFPIMGLVQSPRAFHVKTYRKAGLNTLLAWKNSSPLASIAAKSQLPWQMHIRHSMTQSRDGKPLDWHTTINELTKTQSIATSTFTYTKRPSRLQFGSMSESKIGSVSVSGDDGWWRRGSPDSFHDIEIDARP